MRCSGRSGRGPGSLVRPGPRSPASNSSPFTGSGQGCCGEEEGEERRRKLPKAPLPRFGRPCALQRQVPAFPRVLRASGSVPRQNGGHSCCAAETGSHCFLHTPGAVLGQCRCARVAQRQGYGQTVQIAVLVPQLQSIEGRRDPFRAAESDSHGLSGRKTIEAPQLQYVARWSMPLLRMSFLTCPSLCNDRCSWFR